MMKLYNGNCIDILPMIENDSVDLVVADPPYEQTHNVWDIEIPLEPLWKNLKRIVKPNGAIILFGQGMFTAKVMMSNPKMWRYNLIWDKGFPTGFLNANRMPLRQHEDIMVFYQKPPIYNPQMVNGEPNHTHKKRKSIGTTYGFHNDVPAKLDGLKYPKSIISIQKIHPSKTKHPTEKPVQLIEWLIRTYSDEGNNVLDFCMGCGSVGVASKNLNRNFIGIEVNTEYYLQVCDRLSCP